MASNTLRASCTANNNNSQLGDSAEILIDGSDTPVTANGLQGYQPTPGDRLLVQQVGSQIEIVQFLTQGTVPYLDSTDANNLQDQINNTNTNLGSNQQALEAYLGDTLANLSGGVASGTLGSLSNQLNALQQAHDALQAVGTTGIGTDEIWVGDVANNTVKLVPISTWFQYVISTFADPVSFMQTGLNLGDVTFSGTQVPPMTTFYTTLTAYNATGYPMAVSGKDYNVL